MGERATHPSTTAQFSRGVDSATTELETDIINRARQLADLNGYVTSLPAAKMDGQAVISAYHDLWQVERSFRMVNSDLHARTGLSIRNVVRQLRPLRSATLEINVATRTSDRQALTEGADRVRAPGSAGSVRVTVYVLSGRTRRAWLDGEAGSMTETISSVTTTDVVLDEDAQRGLAGRWSRRPWPWRARRKTRSGQRSATSCASSDAALGPNQDQRRRCRPRLRDRPRPAGPPGRAAPGRGFKSR